MTLRGRGILDTSIVISLFRYFCRWYRSLEQRISCIYHNSQTHSLIGGFRQKTKICFRYSFLGRATETEQASPVVLDDSRVVRYLISFYKRWKDKIIYYLKTSLVTGFAKDTKEGLKLFPLRIISIILGTAILANAFFSVILHRQIGLWSFFIQVLLLFASVAGLSCQADYSTIKENSVFLKKLQKV